VLTLLVIPQAKASKRLPKQLHDCMNLQNIVLFVLSWM
jgi:hypothetical protein